jgi:hypothetical protein
MAARINGQQLSVRVEGPLFDEERGALVSLGFTDNSSYLSQHFHLGQVPAARVLGVLFFHPKLVFWQRASSIEEVPGGK